MLQAEKRGRAGASVPTAETSVAHRGSGICRAAAGATSSPVAAAAVEAEVMKEDLAVSENMLPGGVVELKVKVPQKQVAKAWSQAIKFYAKNLVMEGFRKGKKARPNPLSCPLPIKHCHQDETQCNRCLKFSAKMSGMEGIHK